MGDLTRLGRTNPRPPFVAQGLSQFAQNPGPDHISAALRVLALYRKDPSRGLHIMGQTAFSIRAKLTLTVMRS